MTGTASAGAVAAVGLRRLAVLLALLTALLTVRTPLCADGMAPTMPSPLAAMPAVAAMADTVTLAGVSMPAPACPMSTMASTVGLAGCLLAPAGLSLTAGVALRLVHAVAVVVAAPPVAALPAMVAAPGCAVGLHQMCVSRT